MSDLETSPQIFAAPLVGFIYVRLRCSLYESHGKSVHNPAIDVNAIRSALPGFISANTGCLTLDRKPPWPDADLDDTGIRNLASSRAGAMGWRFAKPIRFHLPELHGQREVQYNRIGDLSIGAAQEINHLDVHLANSRKGVMKALYYSGLARAGLIVRSDAVAPLRRFLESFQLFPGFTRKARRCAARILLPKGYEWVQVESGLAQGVWLQLNLRDEAAYWLGSYEARVQGLLKNLCEPGSIFYDIGANLGFFSFAVAQCIGLKGKVIAFEPEQDNCVRFKEMAVRNNLQDRVTLVEAAVWSFTSSAGLPFKRGRRPRAQGGVLADGISPVLAEGEIMRVPALSLDDFLRPHNPVPDVLKIDVEGGECEVLKGAADLLCRKKPAVICEVHREQTAEWIADWLPRKGYVASWSIPNELYPRLLVAQAASAAKEGKYFACK